MAAHGIIHICEWFDAYFTSLKHNVDVNNNVISLLKTAWFGAIDNLYA